MDALIQLDGLKCCFTNHCGERIEALAGVDLQVNAGDRWALMGRNGSGKSTLLLAMAGLIDPSAGIVLYRGRPLAQNPEHITGDRIALVMADIDAAIVGVSVEEDIAFGLYQQGLPQVEVMQRIDEVLELLGLEDFRRFSPHELPRDRRVLVALAGAVALRPDVLLLDEAVSGLDEPGRQRAERAVSAMVRGGGAVVCATHDVAEAAACDRVVVLDRGRVAAMGAPRDVLADPCRLERWGLRVPDALRLSAAVAPRAAGSAAFTAAELVGRLCL